MQYLPTDRTILSMMFPRQLAADLNTIIHQADGKTTSPKEMNSFAHLYKSAIRMNEELKRRGIEYRISDSFCKKSSFFIHILIIPSFVAMFQFATALNLLSEDYNKRGS